MESIPWDVVGPSLVAFGGWGLAFHFVRLMYLGKIVPKSTLDAERSTSNLWREAYETERDARRRVLVPMAQLQREVLTSIPHPTGEIPVGPTENGS